ncbi:hypothetical protein D3C78_1727530 [compost metagenome]
MKPPAVVGSAHERHGQGLDLRLRRRLVVQTELHEGTGRDDLVVHLEIEGPGLGQDTILGVQIGEVGLLARIE